MNLQLASKLGNMNKKQLAELIMNARFCQQAAIDPLTLPGVDPEEIAIHHESAQCIRLYAAAVEEMAMKMMAVKFVDLRNLYNDRAVEYAINEELSAEWQPDLKILECLTDDEVNLHTERPLTEIEVELELEDKAFQNTL